MTFRDAWSRAVERAGEREFLAFEDGAGAVARWTYAEFDALVEEVAAALQGRGCGPGRPVHVALANSPAFVALWLAAVRIGAPLVPADPSATARELSEQVRRTQPAVGVCAREIVVRGRRGVELFAGYLDDPETTERAFRDGAVLTGDLARRDADGRFYFVGRRGDLLKVSGENVSTAEIEAVVGAHPGVLDAAVVGEPDPMRDEVPVAHVVRADSAPELDEAELAAYCERELAPAKRPRRFVFHPELPRTSVGKIRKFML